MDKLEKLREINDTKHSYNLSTYYNLRLLNIIKDNDLEKEELLEFLINLYYVDNVAFFHILEKQLLKRIEQGINRKFIVKLRGLYTVLGHFLKRIRYI